MAQVDCINADCPETYDPSQTGGVCPECSTPAPPDKIPDSSEENGDDTVPVDEPTCGSCGEEVPQDANVCPYCGEDLEDEGSTTSSPEEDIPTCDSCGEEVPEDANICPYCGEDIDGESGQSQSGSPTVALEIEGEEKQIVEDGEVVLDTDDDKPDNAFGMKGRKAAVNNGIERDDALKIHRDQFLVEVEGDEIFIQVPDPDKPRNPTKLNGESLSKGERRQVSDGDEIDLSGVTTAKVNFAN
jgi:RNA polymerase subunit RPABC4/transcription elongation factor Spt4